MWVISKRLVFIAHPKTASRAVRDAVIRLGGRQVSSHHGIDHEVLEEEKARGASVGCVIRNPYDVMVSWYFHMEARHSNTPRPFSKWVREIMVNGNGHIENGLYFGFHLCDTVMRFESLIDDWYGWATKCGLKYEPLQYVGVSLKRSYQHYSRWYDEKSRQAVADHFAKEFKLGQYVFEEEPCG